MNAVTAALEDARTLWPHNDLVVGFDLATANAVQQALQGNTVTVYCRENDSLEARDHHRPQVRLLYVDAELAPANLLDMLHANQLPTLRGTCDRCCKQVTPVARLWVPAGGSIVQVGCCFECWNELNHSFADLVWR